VYPDRAPRAQENTMNAAIALALAMTAQPGSDELKQALEQIEALRVQNERLATKVEGLERRVAEDEGAWITEERAAEIRAIVADVLADGATRTSLAADGATSGWDKSKGFFLASADGAFSLSIKGDAQIRWAYDSRDIGGADAASGSPSSSTSPDADGFEIRRSRLTFAGNIVDSSWTYSVQALFNRAASSSSNTSLNDAYIEKALGGGFTLRAGQFKAPFLREELVSTVNQLAVERSSVNEVFSVSRSQGVRFGWSDETMRFEAFYGDALRANATGPYALSGANAVALNAGASQGVPTGANTSFAQVPTDYAFAGRFEFKPSGDWKQFRDMQSFRGESAGMLFGLAAYAERVDASVDGPAPESLWSVTGDATIDFGGANVLAYAVYRSVSLSEAAAVRGGGTDDSLEQWGAVVQGGLFVADDVEIFARYELGDTDTDRYRTNAESLAANGDELSVATAGFNWWPAGSANRMLKFTLDFGYAFDPLVDFSSSGAQQLVDYTAEGGATSDGQWLLRSQLQFQF
jgi:hypothetical protein